MAKTDWLGLTQQAYDACSAYIEQNWRSDWDYSLRAFRNEHATGSKYLSEDYKARSRLYRPKTRSVIRKNEAAGAVSLFSNMEIVDLQPGNPDDPLSVASRDAMKEVLEYRLTKTIPWFQVCMGGIQDAQVTGAVCSYQYWEYEHRGGRLVKDKPCIELRPMENIRIDAGASWLDPVGTSPYFCDIIPMYVCDVIAMMNNVDPKTKAPKWKRFDEAIIRAAKPSEMDRARLARLGKQQDPHAEDQAISSFDVVWVMRWFMKDSQGVDHCYYTLGTNHLLTDPKPIEEVYFHGERPYVLGYAILETHKVLKTSMPILVRPLQQETNAVANDRLDNVKFVLHKRWFVARGRQVDVNSLVRGAPGAVTLMTDPKTDVEESNWPDVTSSAYVEQDRLSADFDDLAGNFSPSTSYANKAVKETLGGAKIASAGAGIMTDYLLRTIIETWVEPVLRQLVKLEAYYETDENVLALCAKKARLFPRYGISQITDQMLKNDVHLTVNVGMGSSNPQERLQKFLFATDASIRLIQAAPPGANVSEMLKELWSNAGYRDGARFFDQQGDPRLMRAMQVIQQYKGALEGKMLEMRAQASTEQAKIASTERVKAAQLQVDLQRIQGDLQLRAAELLLEEKRLELERLKIQAEVQGQDQEMKANLIEAGLKIEEAQAKLEHERMKIGALAAKTAADIAKTEAEAQATDSNEKRISGVAEQVTESMKEVGAAFAAIAQQLQKTHEGIGAQSAEVIALKDGMRGMASHLSRPSRKARGFTLRKGEDKRTQAVLVSYDDGTEEELPVRAA